MSWSSGRTTIGAGTALYPFAAIGGPPQDTSYKGEPTTVVVGAELHHPRARHHQPRHQRAAAARPGSARTAS